MMGKYIAVMLGASVGGLLRFIVASMLTARVRSRFPIGTFVVNLTGCFLIGLAMTILVERFPNRLAWRYLLVTGFLGGYTTFSSFEYESVIAFQTGYAMIALLNIVGSVVLGFAGTWLGIVLSSTPRKT